MSFFELIDAIMNDFDKEQAVSNHITPVQTVLYDANRQDCLRNEYILYSLNRDRKSVWLYTEKRVDSTK